jgi:hypothetical protein
VIGECHRAAGSEAGGRGGPAGEPGSGSGRPHRWVLAGQAEEGESAEGVDVRAGFAGADRVGQHLGSGVARGVPAEGVRSVAGQPQRADVDEDQSALGVHDAVAGLEIAVQGRVAARAGARMQVGDGLGRLPDEPQPVGQGLRRRGPARTRASRVGPSNHSISR